MLMLAVSPRLLICLMLLLLLPRATLAFRILVISPKFAHSHSAFIGTIADILVDAGHNVTTLIPIIDDRLSDGTTKSKIIDVPAAAAAAEKVRQLMGVDLDYFELEPDNVPAFLQNGRDNTAFFSAECHATLTHPRLLERLAAEHFDAVITEGFDYCGIGISALISARSLITVSPTILFTRHAVDIGMPLTPASNPAVLIGTTNVESIWWRFRNVFFHGLIYHFFSLPVSAEQAVFDELYGAAAPNLAKVASSAAVTLVNSDPLFDFGAPTLSRVVSIAGITATNPKPLGQEWEHVLAQREKSVLVSFGSIARAVLMSVNKKRAFLKAFATFRNVTFIWKYEEPTDDFGRLEASAVPNVLLTKWMPQNDLLHDERVAAFITHGGMGSILETARHGVPALVVPIFGDQPRNGAALKRLGAADLFSKHELTNVAKLRDAIARLLQPSYRERARHVSRMLASRAMHTPRDTLLHHVAFAAEFGPLDALKPLSLKLSFIQEYMIDVILLTLVALIASLFVIGFFLKLAAKELLRVVHTEKLKIS